MDMTGEHIDLTPNTFASAQEIDDVVSQFRLFTRRLSQQQMQKFFDRLSQMTEADLIASGHQDDVCPICFNSFLATLTEEEVARAMDSPAHPVDELGVIKLQSTCGHMFCRKDIVKWVTEGHDSCPACRRPLVTDEDRREGGFSPSFQLGENWLRPWVVDPNTVVRNTGPPTQLPTLSIDSFRALSVTENERQFTSMYS